jgi:hypothetical protein
MKVAVLVFGMYREFDISVKSWDFLNELDCDVYFSTWDKSYQENKNMNIFINETITEEKIKNHIPNATISILKEIDFPDLNTSTKKMIFHWKNCLSMVDKSEKKYDQIMLIRPDAFIKTWIPYSRFNTFIESDRIYGCEWIQLVGNNSYTMDDTFIFGHFDVMSKFIKELPISLPPHHEFVIFLMSIGLYVQKIEVGSSIVRPNCRFKDDLTFNDVGQLRHEYFENFHKIIQDEN